MGNFWKTKLRGQLKNQEFRNFLGIWNICYIFWNREFLKKMAGEMEVKLANDVYRCCFHHALSSQAEEVMGILIGEKISEKDGTTVIEVSALRIVPRLDKRKDRVEISDDQIIKTTQVAEDLALKLKKPNLRVVGWYHSHPNITVWPSHVDLRTQFNYQRLMITSSDLYSVFTTSTELRKRISMKLLLFKLKRMKIIET